MDEMGRREEEARREAGERRRSNPRGDAGGPRQEDPAFDEQRYGAGEGRSRRGDRTVRGSSEASGRIRSSSSGGRQRSGSPRGQTGGLYGSEIGGDVLGSAIAELVGTFILVFTGTAVVAAAVLLRPTAGPGIYDSLAVALAFGLALTAIVAAIGHVSGAHVNPAITLGLAITNKFPWQYVPVYIGAQLVGGILGAVGTWIAYRSEARRLVDLGATIPAENVGDLQALVVEILVTFILMFIVISVATDDRAPAGVAPLAVGFALACGVLIAGPVTGGSLNPARTLGPMILAGEFTAVWVYIVGPIIGAALAALLYDRFVSKAGSSG